MSFGVFWLCAFIAINMQNEAYGAPSVPPSEKVKQIEKELSERQAGVQELEQKARAVAEELEGLRGNLIEATKQLQTKQAEQGALEERLKTLEKETAQRGALLKEAQDRLANMTGALLQLSRKPPGLLFLHEESADDHIHRTILLRSLLPRIREETASVTLEIDAFRDLQGQMEAQRRVVASARQNLQWQQHNLDQLVKVRQGYLKKTQEEKEEMARQLAALTNEAQDLRQLMEKVSRPDWGRKVGVQKPETASLKTGLRMPIAGRVVRGFGEKDEFGIVSEGLTLAGAYGSPIVAPQSGRVVFKGPFRGYGQVIILQHPGGYHSFLSGFARIDAEMGQRIDSGEPLGILSVQGEGRPEVYFEWRKGTQPIDPAKS